MKKMFVVTAGSMCRDVMTRSGATWSAQLSQLVQGIGGFVIIGCIKAERGRRREGKGRERPSIGLRSSLGSCLSARVPLVPHPSDSSGHVALGRSYALCHADQYSV